MNPSKNNVKNSYPVNNFSVNISERKTDPVVYLKFSVLSQGRSGLISNLRRRLGGVRGRNFLFNSI